MTDQSPVEHIKRASRFLRGTLAESLVDPLTGAIREDDTTLIKFHGSYQQDDRDIREERRHQKLEPAYSFMIPHAPAGGICTPEQWLKLDAIAREYAGSGLRITTAPGFPVARRGQDRAEDDDAGAERGARRYDSRLRGREPQRDGECQPGRVDGASGRL
jgi:sulfite reductase (NADPH) hemoprotein beta-component